MLQRIGYSTSCVDFPRPEKDIHFIWQKVQAEADLILTQSFCDVDGFFLLSSNSQESGTSVIPRSFVLWNMN
jgi:5,10-methylenetetrahydrofolate reductase